MMISYPEVSASILGSFLLSLSFSHRYW